MRLSPRNGLIIALTLGPLVAAPVWTGFSIWAEQRALSELRDQARRTARGEMRLFASDLDKFRLLPLVLGEYTDLSETLVHRDVAARRRMDAKLELLARRTGAPVIYLIDASGETISASNARSPENFVGRNYRFRPYFIRAMRDGAAEYYAVGNVSGRPGLFLARRLGDPSSPLGVVVIKVEFDRLTDVWRSDPGETLAVDQRGIVLFSTDPRERFRTIRPLDPQDRAAIAASGQFGHSPLSASRYHLTGGEMARGPAGERMIPAVVDMPIEGWRLIHLAPAVPALAEAANLARLYALAATLLLWALVGLLVWRITRAWRLAADRAALEAAVVDRTEALSNEMAERARIDLRFREAREELAQANRLGSLGSITAALAHEINQPVATIRTLAENARRHLAAGRLDRVEKALSTAVDLTARIGSITQEMRRFARRGKGEIGPVPLDAVIDGARLLVGDRFRRAGVRLVLPEAGQPAVIAGRVRLEQVVVNLLQNALDAVEGGQAPEVVVSVDHQAGRVLLRVSDNGPGVDPALGDTIFEPFVTGKPEGLGLGLGIVRDIVAEFDGVVRVDAGNEGGAVFVVVLRGA